MVEYGPRIVIAPLLSNSGGFNPENALQIGTIAARFLSFGSYEIPRFLIEDATRRTAYLMAHPWLVPFFVPVCIVGLLQPLLILWGFVRRGVSWELRVLLVLTVVEIWGSFLMSARPPTARNYYILFPVAALIAAQGMAWLFASERGRRLATIVVGLAFIYHALLAAGHYGEFSLYTNRAAVATAIETRNPAAFSPRRPDMEQQTLLPK
jgi:4-amino-4-deoxy-L-arabinose transferase-like glycosyltransferase